MDKFRVEVISQTPNPQQVIYAALHQDYSEEFVYEDRENWPSEALCGEIIVKRLLAGNRGHYGCYSADTEVLTKKGWLRWDEVRESDELLAVDINTNKAHFEKPAAIQCLDLVAGDQLYSIANDDINLLVTQDHRMVVSELNNDAWHFCEAKDLYQKPARFLLNCYLDQKNTSMPEMPQGIDSLEALKLAGFFFGDGLCFDNPQQIRFQLEIPEKITYLKSFNFKVNYLVGNIYTIKNDSLYEWIYQHFTNGITKVIPDWILTLPYEGIKAFWEGLKNSSFDSTSKEALDIIQATAHINGFTANILNNQNYWQLRVSDNNTSSLESDVNQSFVDYKGKVYCATVSTGALLVRRENKVVICGNCLEHPQIVFNCGYFPHSVMQQARTHRVSVSFDVQSMRYTGSRMTDVVTGKRDVEEVFYLRPVGYYSDRQGKKYCYSSEQRQRDLEWCLEAAKRYQEDMAAGMAEEHARGKLPFDYRQHFVVSFNLRSFLHFCDLRHKKDAQLEIQKLCELMWPHFQKWSPAIAEWYEINRLGKARLSP